MKYQFSEKCKAFKEYPEGFQMDETDYETHFKNKTFYTCNGYVMSKNQLVSRVIMECIDPGLQVDHVDHDKFDNRKSNLRIATPSQNAYNKTVYKNNESGYTGCHFYKPSGKWMAYLSVSGKRKHLGYFEKLEDAYTAYVGASKALHGEFAPQRVKDMDVEPLVPQPKVYKSPPWSRENYRKNRDQKLKNQTIRNIKKYGKTPKDSTLQNNKITIQELQDAIKYYNDANL